MKFKIPKFKSENKDITLPISLGVFLLAVILIIFLISRSVVGSTPEVIPTPVATTTLPVVPTNKIQFLQLEATSIFVKDLNSGKVLFAKNENEKHALASLTKVMTALTSTKELSDTDTVQVLPDDLIEDASGIYPWESFSAQKLRDVMLINSSNGASNALANAVEKDGKGLFINRMNSLAKEIGMKNTEFRNPSGLDISDGQSGATGTAYDISLLFEYILKEYPDILSITKETYFETNSIEGVYHKFNNTNKIVHTLPNIVASKTGFTNIAGGNLSVVIDPGLNNPIIITVLGSSLEGRFTDVEKIINAL